MLATNQIDFYDRWLQKADNHTGTDIATLIDKYVTLFINYNFLYNIVPIKKAQETGNPREKVGDRAGATTFTMDFVGAGVISSYVTEHDLDDQIKQLAIAMPHFNIDLNKGKPQPQKDKKLISDLISTDDNIKILALLRTLYSIRCNIVHGEKGLHQYQEMLLLPAIKLLRALISIVYNRVTN